MAKMTPEDLRNFQRVLDEQRANDRREGARPPNLSRAAPAAHRAPTLSGLWSSPASSTGADHMQIVTIAEATARRLTRYFTGIPCRHGHVSERRVSDRGCCECGRLRSRIENMTPAQIEKVRSRVRLPVEDMTPDQLRRYEAANRRRLTNQLRAKFRKLWG